MDLDTLSEIIKKNEEAFNDFVRRHARKISLRDILKEIETRTPSEFNEFGVFSFRKGQYEIMVSTNKINLFGYRGIVDREFTGQEITDCYNRLVKAYAEKQKEEIPF